MSRRLISLLIAGFLVTATLQPLPAHAFGPDAVYAQAAIMNAGANAPKVARLKVVPRLGVVRLDLLTMHFHLDEGNELASFRISAQKNAKGVAQLRAALKNNPVTRRKLTNVPINRIVGVRIGSDGSLVVYRL